MNNNNYTKVIFLDMDGVVNSNFLIRNYCNNLEAQGLCYDDIMKTYKKDFKNSRELIFPELAAIITRICTETDCGIVWSSSWRTLPEYKRIIDAKEMFNRRGLPGDRLFSYTPDIYRIGLRSFNIEEWIKQYGENIKKFAIIDDTHNAKYITKNCRFFQTNIEDGITNKLADKIINWLNS